MESIESAESLVFMDCINFLQLVESMESVDPFVASARCGGVVVWWQGSIRDVQHARPLQGSADFRFQGLPGKNVYGPGGPLPTNNPSRLRSHTSKRSTLHHFWIPASQNDQHYITSALPNLKRTNTPSLLRSQILRSQTLHHFCILPDPPHRRMLCFEGVCL